MPTTLSQYLAVNAGTLCERGCARVRAIVYKGTRNPLCDACLRTKDVWPCTMPTVEFTKHPDPLRPLYFQWHARRLNSYPTNRYLAALLPSHGAVLEHCFRIHNGFVDELIAWQGRWWTAHITDTESETFEAGLKV